ncbi:MAG TPA: copper chaperone PCu(A)C [Steroidobacteraceae bacterium]|nr:copper chaperone PCu(A)C [Steroidobacteraceae bacterium]
MNFLSVLGAALAALAALTLHAQPAAPASALSAAGAWVRAIPGAPVAAAYMTLHNGGQQPVRVIGVRSALAGHAMIHETRLENGVSTMRPHEPLEIPPGASVELKPGGLHVMLHDLAHPLAVDEQVPLELLLDGGGRVEVRARVRPPGAE